MCLNLEHDVGSTQDDSSNAENAGNTMAPMQASSLPSSGNVADDNLGCMQSASVDPKLASNVEVNANPDSEITSVTGVGKEEHIDSSADDVAASGTQTGSVDVGCPAEHGVDDDQHVTRNVDVIDTNTDIYDEVNHGDNTVAADASSTRTYHTDGDSARDCNRHQDHDEFLETNANRGDDTHRDDNTTDLEGSHTRAGRDGGDDGSHDDIHELQDKQTA